MVIIITIMVELDIFEMVIIVTIGEHMEKLRTASFWRDAYCNQVTQREQYKSASRYTNQR